MDYMTVEYWRPGKEHARGFVTVSRGDAGMVAAAAGGNGFSSRIRPASPEEIIEAERREP